MSSPRPAALPDKSPLLRGMPWAALLLCAMLALAGVNRWRLTPALQASIASPDEIGADSSLAVSAMRRSLVLEASAGLAILALVAWFGTLEPFAD